MSTQFFNDQWRMPNNKNQSLVSNYSMNGSGAEINASGVPFSSESWTTAVWLKLSRTTGTGIIWDMQYGSAGGLKLIHQYGTSGSNITAVWFLFYGPTYSNFSSQVAITKDNWHHVVVRYNKGVDYRIYVDSVLSGKLTLTGSPYGYPTTRNLEIFKIGGMQGSLDQFCIFDYALSDTATTVGDTATGQMATLYGGGTAVTNPMALSPKSVAYYQLGDESVDNGANYLVPNNSLQDYVFNFNGTSNKIELRNSSSTDTSLNLTPNASISAWIYKTSVNNYGCVYANSRGNSGYFGFSLLVNNLNKLQLRCNLANSIFTSLATVPHDEWVHVAGTYKSGSSSEVKLSINGVIETFTATGVQPPLNYTNPAVSSGVEIGGGFLSGSSLNWYGEISNVSLFDSVLTSAQITTIYNNGTPSDISSLNPVSWWKLNAEDVFAYPNWIIRDSAGTNNGASVGMTSANLVQSNLQYTSGYSPYALDFDGTSNYIDVGSINITGSCSISLWFKTTTTSAYTNFVGGTYGSGVQGMFLYLGMQSSKLTTNISGVGWVDLAPQAVNDGLWHNFVFAYDSTTSGGPSKGTFHAYLDGVLTKTLDMSSSTSNWSIQNLSTIGSLHTFSRYFNGSMSNVSLWNTTLTSSQATEIYNESVPSDLNNHSAYSNLVNWWQLGSNSGFNAATSQWTVLDEKGTSNGLSSVNMANDDVINGVGYTGNGLGATTIDINSEAPYSAANSISVNIDASDRVNDVPS